MFHVEQTNITLEKTDMTAASSQKSQPLLDLDGAAAMMRKISINVLNKDSEQTLFTCPVEGIELPEKPLDALMGYGTFRSWYNQGADKIWRPMPWWEKRNKGDFQVEDEFVCEGVIIRVAGGKELEFENYEPEDEDDEKDTARPAARITNIILKPTPGGITLLSLHLQVRPGIGKTNLALQEHQFRHIHLTLTETKLDEKEGRQQPLPLVEGNTDSAAGTDEQAANTQVAAATAKPGEVIDGTTPKSRAATRARNAH